MTTPLNGLIFPSREADVWQIEEGLRQGGFEPRSKVVGTESEYLNYLEPTLDIILADHRLPQVDALKAMLLVQERGLDIPFIFVTGVLGDEFAVECIKRGVADYSLKNYLDRLGGAVSKALEEKRLRMERTQAEAALGESDELYRAVVEKRQRRNCRPCGDRAGLCQPSLPTAAWSGK